MNNFNLLIRNCNRITKVITIFILILMLGGCKSKNTEESIEECLLLEMNQVEDIDFSDHYECKILIEDFFKDEAKEYLPNYTFEMDSAFYYHTSEVDNYYLSINVYFNTDDYYGDSLCDDCKRLQTDVKSYFSSMTSETVELIVRFNFNAKINVPVGVTPIVRNFTFGN